MLSCPDNIVSLFINQPHTTINQIFKASHPSMIQYRRNNDILYSTDSLQFINKLLRKFLVRTLHHKLGATFAPNADTSVYKRKKKKKKIKTHYQPKPCFPNQSRKFFIFSKMRETHLAESRLEASQNEGLDWD